MGVTVQQMHLHTRRGRAGWNQEELGEGTGKERESARAHTVLPRCFVQSPFYGWMRVWISLPIL